MASKILDESGKVCVCLMEMSIKVKNKALVNNYNVITCVLRKNDKFDKFDKLPIQVSLK